MQIADAEEHECEVQHEEEQKECDRRPKGDEEEDRREYEPTLRDLISISLHDAGTAYQ